MSSWLLALLWLTLIGGLLVGLFWLYRAPPQVTFGREVVPNAFQGTRQPLTVRFTLRSRRPMRFILEDPLPRTVVADIVPLAAGELYGELSGTLSTHLTLNKRGEFSWPGAILRWADPLGLFWRSMPLNAPQRLEVFPGTHGLVLPDILRPLLSEGALTRQLGLEDPISLRAMREYVPGDPPGRVSWRRTAHTGTLTVREPEHMAASSVTIYLDQSRGGEVFIESAVRLAASLIQEAVGMSLPVAVATNAGVTTSGREAGALHAALLRLAQVQPDLSPPVIPPTRSGGNLILLTASPTQALIEQAMQARAAASRVVIVAIPEGFYLEPGEQPRRQWVAAPDTVRALERQAGVLAGLGILVFVLRGNQSVLKLGA